MNDQDVILEMHIGRAQSPDVEFVVQRALTGVFRELLETRGIYQNITLSEDLFEPFTDEDYCCESLGAEFRKRPFHLCSRGEGNDGSVQDYIGRRGNDPLGTPHDELTLSFYLPNIHSHCAVCNKETTFLSMICSGEPRFGGPHPIVGTNTEQVFHLFYRCGNCRNQYLAFQVLRRGLKIQLTGRSIPFRPKLAPEWPKVIREIVHDANAAASENDLAAAYYHLRTAIEFYVKSELGIDVAEKVDGSVLCDKYNATLDNRLKQGFPSLAGIYALLSSGLHSRQVAKEEYDRQFSDILNHIKAKALFGQYS